MPERAEDLQTEALRAFTLLTVLQPDLPLRPIYAGWRGTLILACGLGGGGMALLIAANIAGACSMVIDQRAGLARAALRSGACDFVVNTVDEAMRILKNEIRQRRPISVALSVTPNEVLAELLARGVLPELFTAFRTEATAPEIDLNLGCALREFAALGTILADFDGFLPPSEGVVDAARRLRSFTHELELNLESFAFQSSAELQAFDARLVQAIPASDPRQVWCAAAPRFFHRERPYRRVVYLTLEERERVTIGDDKTSSR